MVFSWNLRKKLLSVLISRMGIFLFLMCLLTLFLYAVGTNQGFIDSTQLALLRLYIILGISLAISSLYGFILNIVRILKFKMTRYILRTIGYFVLVIFSIVSVLTAMFIITLSSGNGVSL